MLRKLVAKYADFSVSAKRQSIFKKILSYRVSGAVIVGMFLVRR